MVKGQLVVGFLSLCCLGGMIYGFLMVVGGPRWANWFARGVNRTTQHGVRHVGRTTGRVAIAYPMAAGVAVIVGILVAMSRC
jgi:hypothetical protein